MANLIKRPIVIQDLIALATYISQENLDAGDRTILSWAAQNESIVFTHDLDFGAILATSQAKTPSILHIRSQNILPDTSA